MFLVTSSDTSLTEAIANTCMGIGTVFLMLIFISLIISLFGFIPKLEAKLAVMQSAPKTPAAPAAPVAAAKPVAKTSENLMDDAELVAVITAAIYAASGSAGTSSKDKLVVRSIRRAR